MSDYNEATIRANIERSERWTVNACLAIVSNDLVKPEDRTMFEAASKFFRQKSGITERLVTAIRTKIINKYIGDLTILANKNV